MTLKDSCMMFEKTWHDLCKIVASFAKFVTQLIHSNKRKRKKNRNGVIKRNCLFMPLLAFVEEQA